MIDPEIFSKRRSLFLTELGGKAAIIPAANLVTHHADCHYPFRQDSDFWYLTGFDEPNAVAVFLSHKPPGEQFILFVMPNEKEAEVWNGFRWGVEGAKESFGADSSHSIEELPQLLTEYLIGSQGIAFRVGKYPKVEPLVLNSWINCLDLSQRSGAKSIELCSPCPILHQLRLIKEVGEIERIREAVRISAEAHELARKLVSPGMNEREIQAIIEKYFLEQGARGPAYGSIVAGGDNACVLHYIENNSLLKEGELLLIDAGCSLNDYYNGDITRTFPISGKFTPEQKAIYEIVLEAQKSAITSIIPGQTAEGIHLTALRFLIDGLIQVGLLKGNIDSIIELGSYRHLYMHRTGHWLGLDVHDVGAYRLGEYPIKLKKGMVLTVEPGIYISNRLPIPDGQPQINEAWQGIGIRIEDDIAITEKGYENLSQAALKEVVDVEK